jgi:hypothetical protein
MQRGFVCCNGLLARRRIRRLRKRPRVFEWKVASLISGEKRQQCGDRGHIVIRRRFRLCHGFSEDAKVARRQERASETRLPRPIVFALETPR